ncbi:hypothetical protein PG997_005769 [Apiospora hydei]|uniref:Uncharacterized protein n=1 Tax=Apiospora hydei TaxID=1337664 RepID=A0ABR1WR59_9PEZI
MTPGRWGRVVGQRDAWTYTPLDAHEDPPGARFEPIPRPPGYPALDFRPRMLKRGVLFTMGLIHLGVLGVLIALLRCSGPDRAYISNNINVYMIARYGPSVIGTLTTSLVRTTVRDLQRMYPYIQMADDGSGRRGGSRASTTIAYPFWAGPLYRFDWFSMGLVFTSFASLQVAFKANLLQVHESEQGWIVQVSTIITYILLVMYGIQVVFFVSAIKWLWSRETGIRSGWDPTNLADTIALFSHFNVPLSIIEPSVTRCNAARLLHNHNFRLGYWEVTLQNNTKSVVYGIRSVGQVRHKTVKLTNFRSHARYRPDTPYNQIPMLHIIPCAICAIGGAICLAGFIYIAASGLFLRQFLIRDGKFTFVTGTLVNHANNTNVTADLRLNQAISSDVVSSDGISSNLILWSVTLRSLPMFVIGMAVGQLAIYDYHHRWSQPLLNMYQGLAAAERTLLLDYLTPSTLGVLTRAWENGEWKVFYYSLLNVLIPLWRLLPVGILSMVNITSGTPDEAVPRGGTSLLDVWLLCFRSRLVQNPEFSECGPLWTKEDLSSTLRLRHDKYLFGAISGLEEDDHRMGFDIAELRRESFWTEFVFYVDPRTHQLSQSRHRVDAKSKEGKSNANEKDILLHNYYTTREEPINLRRRFEDEFERRYFERTGRRVGMY